MIGIERHMLMRKLGFLPPAPSSAMTTTEK